MNYKVLNAPDDGPLTVEERDENGRSVFQSPEEAIGLARRRKKQYPHMDFLVISQEGMRGDRALLYYTYDKPPERVFKLESLEEDYWWDNHRRISMSYLAYHLEDGAKSGFILKSPTTHWPGEHASSAAIRKLIKEVSREAAALQKRIDEINTQYANTP